MKCYVLWCKNTSTNRPEGVTFHRIPADMCNEWLAAIRRPLESHPNSTRRICSEHFTEESFSKARIKGRTLKPYAVPTLKLSSQSQLPVSANNGRALVLDGIIQCTQKDELSYQEMITFLPICNHSNPQKVLIVGGGDGGVAREVQKHPLVKEIVQVEIDEKVVEASKKYLPFMAKGFDTPKLTLNICDGFEYLKNHKNEFDVIITDSSDPIGPAVNLFTESYYKLLKEALKPNGIISCQAGTVWSDLPHVKKTINACRKHFNVVKYANSSVPSYPDGQIGYLLATTDESNDLRQPTFKFTEQQLTELNINYYNDEIHSASFVLPNFVKRELAE